MKDPMHVFSPKGDPSKVISLGNGSIQAHGLTWDLAETLQARDAFVSAYCKEKGWDRSNLTIEQIMVIRSQDGWKTPLV